MFRLNFLSDIDLFKESIIQQNKSFLDFALVYKQNIKTLSDEFSELNQNMSIEFYTIKKNIFDQILNHPSDENRALRKKHVDRLLTNIGRKNNIDPKNGQYIDNIIYLIYREASIGEEWETVYLSKVVSVISSLNTNQYGGALFDILVQLYKNRKHTIESMNNFIIRQQIILLKLQQENFLLTKKIEKFESENTN